MRIRKNSRMVVPEGTPLRASLLVCKLNQSPWDDDAFVSQLFEDESDDRFSFTRSSIDPSPILDSNRIIDSPVELVFEYIGKPLSPTPPPSIEQRQEEEKQPVEGPPLGDNFINLSFPSRRACDQPCNEDNHMFSQPQAKRTSYCNMKYLCPSPIKKRFSPSFVPSSSKKRGRPKKHVYETRGKSSATTSAAKNNNKSSDYYFYTEFGPNWGKKRGKVVKPTYNDDSRTSRKGKAKRPALIENNDVIHMNNKNKDNEELIRIKDDDDDDDDNNGDVLIRNRPRKPVKERSLKSLMS